MTRQVFCDYFQKELEGLDRPPYPGEIGQKIYNSVSKQAWQMWMNHSVMVINEYRLNLATDEGQEVYDRHLEDFFFGEGGELPPGYQPQ